MIHSDSEGWLEEDQWWYHQIKGSSTSISLHWVTPQSMTKVSPAELLFGKKLRTRFDLLRPNMAGRVRYKQEREP